MDQIYLPIETIIWKNSFRQQSSGHAGHVSLGCPWGPHSPPVPGRWAWPGRTRAGLSRGLPRHSMHKRPLQWLQGTAAALTGTGGVSAPTGPSRKHSQCTGAQAQCAEGHCSGVGKNRPCSHVALLPPDNTPKGSNWTSNKAQHQFQEIIQKHLVLNKVKSKMPGIHSKFTGRTKKQKNKTWRRKKINQIRPRNDTNDRIKMQEY